MTLSSQVQPSSPRVWGPVDVRTGACVAGAASVAGAAGALVALNPLVCLAAMVLACVGVAVWTRPVLAAVLVAAITPFVAGIDRGRLLPVLRPNEALVVFLAGVLLLRAVVRAPTGWRPRLRVTPLEWTVVAMASANSVVLLVVMVLRGQDVGGDDLSYALVLWKYLALYALVRSSVHSDRDVQWCLWAALASATVVGVIGMLQALDLAGVRGMLVGLYAPFGYTGALAVPRGGSTLGLPAATADLLILNLVAAMGLWWKDHRHGPVLLLAGVVCIGGTFAAAEFSSAFGLAIAVVCTGLVRGRLGILRLAPFGLLGATGAMWPVIQHRLAGFQSVSGLPVSWTTRIANLENYFFPQLFSGTNPLLGVRPSARVVAEHQGTGFVWIESGYVWLLWGGGLPLLLSFLAFVVVALRTLGPWARRQGSATSVAALAAFVGVVVCAALMVFDPHITYRGSADWLFSLLAMSASGAAAARTEQETTARARTYDRARGPAPARRARGWSDERTEHGR
jgi:hypothetical protein